ncbi:MAG: hypothetical protein SCALA702_23270 [Melioribacteraceae bacterium]|nr:MAG: hypothetical protein SCALA702_23270 [Melioribacteraceae bacterium]
MEFMRKLLLHYLLFFLFSGKLFSFPGEEAKIITYFNSADVKKIDSLCEVISADPATTPFDRHYCAGFVHNFLGEYYLQRDDEISEKHLTKAITHLEEAVLIKPDAELYALLSSAQGKMVAHVSIFSKMSAGNKAESYLQKAMELDSNNIYVKYVNAIGLMRRPALFGGDKELAAEIFTEILEKYDTFEQPGLVWVSKALIYFRLWQLADMNDEPEGKNKLEKLLRDQYPEFNLER